VSINSLLEVSLIQERARFWNDYFNREGGSISLPKLGTNHMSTEAASVADIVRQAQKHEINVNPIASEVLIFPDKTILPLERFAERPRRKRSKVFCGRRRIVHSLRQQS
jgi:hypothetical protein